jgi:hypothetical protein
MVVAVCTLDAANGVEPGGIILDQSQMTMSSVESRKDRKRRRIVESRKGRKGRR